MSLTSGARIRRNHWTKLPMPADVEVIYRVNAMGARQKVPTKLTYANTYGNEIEDTIDELEMESSDDDSSYSGSDSDSDSDDSTNISEESESDERC